LNTTKKVAKKRTIRPIAAGRAFIRPVKVISLREDGGEASRSRIGVGERMPDYKK
jgi:hypothetical protein